MDSPLTYFAIGIVATWLAVWFARNRKSTLTQQWHRAFALAQELVPAVEQLWLTGKLSKEQRLDAVMAELRNHFPDLQEHHLRWAAENAVHLMNQGKLIPLVSEDAENISGWLQRNP